MSAALQSGAQSFLARYERLKGDLPGDGTVRDAAAAAFRACGLPGARSEAWKYTSLRPLADIGFCAAPAVADANALLGRLPDIDAPRAVFVDGRFRSDVSVLPGGFSVRGFASVPEFGEARREPLAVLNTMLAQDGVIIEVPPGVDGGLLLLASLATDQAGEPGAFHPRHAIRLGAGARLTVLEISVGDGVYLHNPVTSVQVADTARLAHVRLQDESQGAFHLSTLYADIGAGGVYDSFVLNLGARLTRTEVHARLAGVGGAVHLNAAQLLDGMQHADFTTVVRHEAEACASRQTVKNVLAGQARGVFQGRIEVARGAQKTDGYQMNQALLLSPDAEIDSKPELEIFADDVKCSHGATVGELDAAQLFYLRSRGIPEAEARTVLVHAFLAGALDVVSDTVARAVLDRAIIARWERQAA